MHPTLAAAALLAPVQDSPAGEEEGSGLHLLFMMGGTLLIFWLMAILPERKARKKRQALIDAVRKNDKVLTTSGMYATIAAVNDGELVIKFDDGPTRVRVLKSAIASVLGKDDDGGDS